MTTGIREGSYLSRSAAVLTANATLAKIWESLSGEVHVPKFANASFPPAIPRPRLKKNNLFCVLAFLGANLHVTPVVSSFHMLEAAQRHIHTHRPSPRRSSARTAPTTSHTLPHDAPSNCGQEPVLRSTSIRNVGTPTWPVNSTRRPWSSCDSGSKCLFNRDLLLPDPLFNL